MTWQPFQLARYFLHQVLALKLVKACGMLVLIQSLWLVLHETKNSLGGIGIVQAVTERSGGRLYKGMRCCKLNGWDLRPISARTTRWYEEIRESNNCRNLSTYPTSVIDQPWKTLTSYDHDFRIEKVFLRFSYWHHKQTTALKNLASHHSPNHIHSHFLPGSPASDFSLQTLSGTIEYPSATINHSTPIVFYSHNPASGFSQCLWRCPGSLSDLLLNLPTNTHAVFSLWKSEDPTWNITVMHDAMKDEVRSLVQNHR
jgi:hypothetical protein